VRIGVCCVCGCCLDWNAIAAHQPPARALSRRTHMPVLWTFAAFSPHHLILLTQLRTSPSRSCWTFAATSSFSLKYCLAVYAAGFTYDNTAIPVLTPENMVTCSHGNGYGCSGGSGYGAFTYIRDYGVTSAACLPYQEGDDSGSDTNTQCFASCVTDYA
jgi:hypothetical protein